jgi:hypothetical protein
MCSLHRGPTIGDVGAMHIGLLVSDIEHVLRDRSPTGDLQPIDDSLSL